MCQQILVIITFYKSKAKKQARENDLWAPSLSEHNIITFCDHIRNISAASDLYSLVKNILVCLEADFSFCALQHPKDHLFSIRGKNLENKSPSCFHIFYSVAHKRLFLFPTSAKIPLDWSHLTACLLNLDITPKCGTFTFPAWLFVQRSQKPNTCNFYCKAKTKEGETAWGQDRQAPEQLGQWGRVPCHVGLGGLMPGKPWEERRSLRVH